MKEWRKSQVHNTVVECWPGMLKTLDSTLSTVGRQIQEQVGNRKQKIKWSASLAKCFCCSYRGTGLGSQHPHQIVNNWLWLQLQGIWHLHWPPRAPALIGTYSHADINTFTQLKIKTKFKKPYFMYMCMCLLVCMCTTCMQVHIVARRGHHIP